MTIIMLELVRLRNDKARVFGLVGLPIIFWLIFGSGFRSVFQFPDQAADVDYLAYMYPGVITMAVLFASLFSGISVIVEREQGFLREVMAAPVPAWSVAVGVTLAKSVQALTQGILLILLAPLAGFSFTLPLLLALIGMIVLIAFSTASLGVSLALRMDTVEGFHNLVNFLFFPLFFFSSAIFPMEGVPVWMAVLMRLDPLTYAVDGLRHILHSGTPLAGRVTEFGLLTDLAVIITFGVFLAVLGTTSFVRRAVQ